MANAPKAHESLSTEARRMPVQGTCSDSYVVYSQVVCPQIIYRRKERWQFWFVVELGILALIQFIL